MDSLQPKIVWKANTRHPASPQTGISLEWQHSTLTAEKQTQTNMEKVETSYNINTRPLPEIKIGSKVALQNHETKRWDIYGTITDIGPHQCYFIKTRSGRDLVHNRRFLHHHIPPLSPHPTYNDPICQLASDANQTD